MKQIIVAGIVGLAASVWAADPKEEIQNATKALAGKDNYSWTQTSKSQGGGGGGGRGFGGGTVEGKSNKDGVTYIVTKFTNQNGDDMTFESAAKGEKRAFKGQDGWQAPPAAGGGGGGGGGRGRGMFGRAGNPVAQVDNLLANIKDLKSDGDVYSGDLTEAGVKALMTFGGGRRGGGGGGTPPEVKDAKGWAKFWVKDGALSKVEYNVQGKRTFNEQEVDINRTVTIEIKNVGATKIELPTEAADLLK